MPRIIPLTYGDKKIELSFPDGFLAGDLVHPAPPKTKLSREQMAEVIDKALAAPVGTPKLRDMVAGKQVGLVISDEFRYGLQELIAERMLREIFAGEPASLVVFIATGSHDSKVYAKNLIPAIQKAADALGRQVRILPNDCDSGAHVLMGTTALGTPAEVWDEWLKTEVRVFGHESKHHYMNGYSTVDKQICPGLSSRRTIAGTHKQALQHNLSAAGRGPYHADESRRANPFAEDNRLVRLLANRTLIVNGVARDVRPLPAFGLDMISTKDSIDWIRAGDLDAISREMVPAADEIGAVKLARTRYVVISPGGPPACNALYGVQNCFDISLKFAIQPGGEALILAPCLGRPDLPPEVSGLAPDAKAKQLFWDNLVRWRDQPLAEAARWIEQNFELYLWKTDRVLKLLKEQNVRLYLHSEMPDAKVSPGGFIPVSDPNAWIAERSARGDGQARAIDDGNKTMVIPLD